MSEKIILDSNEFSFKINHLLSKHFTSPDTDPIALILGKRSETVADTSTPAFFLNILGYEFPETIFLIKRNELIFISSSKKIEILKTLNVENESFTLKFIENLKNQKINEILKDLSKENPKTFLVPCRNQMDAKNVLINTFINTFKVESSPSLCNLLVKKSESDFKTIKTLQIVASEIFSILLKNLQESYYKNFEDQCIEILDSKRIEKICNPEELEFVDNVKFANGHILGEKILSFRLKYSNLVLCFERSFFINAGKTANSYVNLYEKFSELVKAVCVQINSNTGNSDNMSTINSMLNELTVNCNVQLFTSGYVSKEVSYFNSEIKKALQDENVINLLKSGYVGLKLQGREENGFTACNTFLPIDLNNYLSDNLSNNSYYNLFIPRSDSNYSIYFYEGSTRPPRRSKIVPNKKLKTLSEDRINHQKDLMMKLIENNINHYRGTQNFIEDDKKEAIKTFKCYSDENQVLRKDLLTVDGNNFCVVVPISCYSVPIHVTELKNFAKTENGLKLNLKDSNILKSVVYSTKNPEKYLNELAILKKNFLLKKESFQINTDIERVIQKQSLSRLDDCNIKTDARAAKKVSSGALDLFANGLVYRAFDNITVLEVPFSNIKSVFVSTNENFLIHFNLHEYLLFNNKKTKNVQFSKEFVARISDTTKFSDARTEIMHEKEDERKRENFKRELIAFARKIEEITNSITINYCQSNFFTGIPFKSSAIIEIAENCLVSIQEAPFLIIDLDDIEVAGFERITSFVNYFDLVFINKNMKDFNYISSIDFKYLEYLRDFLNSRDKVFIMTKINIKWTNMLKTIRESPLSFYESGGWMELQPNNEDSDSDTEIEESLETSDSVEDVLVSDDENYDNDTEDFIEDENDSDFSDVVGDTDDEGVDDESS